MDPKVVESLQAILLSFGFRAVATVNVPQSPNVRIWRLLNGAQIILDDNAVDAVFSPDGRSVATINAPGTPNVRIWRISDGQQIILDENAVRVVFNRPPIFELPPFPDPQQEFAPV